MMTEIEKQLTEIIKNLSHQNSEQSSIIKELQEQIKQLQESVNYLTKKRYSSSSEKTRPGQISLFEDAPFFKKQR